MNKVIALFAGIVFGFGLGVGGMLDPAKVVNFLDLAGHWDPTLLFVMGGAVVVTLPAFWLAKRARRPLLTNVFRLPRRHDINWRLLTGAALFGVGWGLAGLCPGPAVAALASLQAPVLGFLAAMVVGQWLADRAGADSH